ncbi:MAG: RluA family pseudouridine synthase [Hyphomicrobiales bacterium]|nr:RluA family pseudouridine synthase [Hyphomicrobiales bacterium]
MSAMKPQLVSADEDGVRLDRWLKTRFPALPHSVLQKLLRTGQVRVDGKRVKPNARVEAGQEVRVPNLADFEPQPPERGGLSLRAPMGLSKADRNYIERMIILEDDDIVILNKPPGVAVQGGTKTTRHIDGLLAGMEDRFGGDRPRLVHRLDRDTSGVLLVAKSRDMASRLGKMFQTRSMQKIYWAVVQGAPKPAQGKVEAALIKATGPDGDRVRKAEEGEADAQNAVTHYSIIERAQEHSWVSLKPVTGRQHQLRAHMHLIGTPILGDNKYGGDQDIAEGVENKLHLHARRLAFIHPRGQAVDITAPLPEHMRKTFTAFGFDDQKYGKAAERE